MVLEFATLERKQRRTFAEHFETMDELVKATEEELKAINEIGEKMAQSVVTYFDNEDVLELLQQFKEYGVNMTYKGIKLQIYKMLNLTSQENGCFNR